MRLNADIIFFNLQKELDVSFNGDNVRELVLLRPEFYIDNNDVFVSNHVYVCSADHLPENPTVEENVLLICLGSNTPPAYFYESCSIMTVSPKEDIFRVFNLVQDIFNKYEAWEGKMNGIIRSSASLQSMLDQSREIFDNPLLLIGADFNYLAYTDKDYLQNNVGINFKSTTFDTELMAVFLSMHEIATDIREPLLLNLMNKSTLSVNLFDGNEFLGCITVFGEFREIRSSDAQLCLYFADMLRQALQLNPQLAGEHSTFRRTLNDLVCGHTISSEQRAVISRHNFKQQFFCLCLDPAHSTNALPKGYVSSMIEQMLPGAISFEHGDHIVALVPCSFDIVSDSGYKSQIREMLLPITLKALMKCGVSHAFFDLYDSAYTYIQSVSALEMGLKYEVNNDIYFFEDHILHKLLSNAADTVPVRFFYTDGLNRLFSHDSSSQVSYIDTLRTYLECNMSVAMTARVLNLHRSSLIDRLERIINILGNNLKDADYRLTLQFLLRMSE